MIGRKGDYEERVWVERVSESVGVFWSVRGCKNASEGVRVIEW